jgi:transposase InsO family protein
MPWKEQTPMSQRKAFIEAAQQAGANISALSRKYGISRKTAYKWLKRLREAGAGGLEDQSRRPKHSPRHTGAEVEAEVCSVRRQHPAWGGRKIHRVLQNQGRQDVPAISTITTILHRAGLIDPQEGQKHRPYHRFEYSQPNQLWQMDFKGYFALGQGGYCHPLTVIDDHSRFLVGLKACSNETMETVKTHLVAIFERFGLPERMLMDNGSAWGFDRDAHHTLLTAWLIRLGIAISHGRPFHPQTQGKTERLNRTLLVEVIQHQALATLPECQTIFDDWGQVYNYERPHEALQLSVPATRYRPSSRPYPTSLPPVTYEGDDWVRKVDISGNIYFQGSKIHISAAFRHQPVAVRPAEVDGEFNVFYCQQKVAKISLRKNNEC